MEKFKQNRDPNDIVNSMLFKKLNLAGQFLVGVSRALTPVKTGRLRGATDFKVTRNTLRIGNNVEYAPYVELGTKPHVILPVNGKALFWKGAKHPVKKVNHPGTKAQPFLMPLITNYKTEIISILSS